MVRKMFFFYDFPLKNAQNMTMIYTVCHTAYHMTDIQRQIQLRPELSVR